MFVSLQSIHLLHVLDMLPKTSCLEQLLATSKCQSFPLEKQAVKSFSTLR